MKVSNLSTLLVICLVAFATNVNSKSIELDSIEVNFEDSDIVNEGVETPVESIPLKSAAPEKSSPASESPSESPVESSTVAPDDSSSEGSTSAVPDDTSTSDPEDSSSDVTEEYTSDAPENSSSAAPEETTTAAPAEITTAAPGETTTAAPGETTTAAPAEITTTAPGETTTAAPGETTTAAPAGITTVAPAEITTAAPGETTTTAPEESSPAAPEHSAENSGSLQKSSEEFSAPESRSFSIFSWLLKYILKTLRGINCTITGVFSVKESSEEMIYNFQGCGTETTKEMQDVLESAQKVINISNDIMNINANVCENPDYLSDVDCSQKASSQCVKELRSQILNLNGQIKSTTKLIKKVPANVGDCVSVTFLTYQQSIIGFPKFVETCAKL